MLAVEDNREWKQCLWTKKKGQCSVTKKGNEEGFGCPHSDRYCMQSVALLSHTLFLPHEWTIPVFGSVALQNAKTSAHSPQSSIVL